MAELVYSCKCEIDAWSGRMTIRDLEVADTATYQCEAANKHGTAKANFALKVQS